MQAVILAAGRGNRLRPLTDSVPKPLIPIKGREIISSAIDGLIGEGITDIVFVVKYMADKVQAYVDQRYGTGFRFVTQGEVGGTGAAILAAKPVLNRDFVMLYGDNLFVAGAVSRIVHGDGHGTVGVITSENPERYGCVSLRSDGYVEDIIEKPTAPKSNLVVLGGYRFPLSVLGYLEEAPLSVRGEIETPDAVNVMIQHGAKFSVADVTGSEDVATYEDMARLDSLPT